MNSLRQIQLALIAVILSVSPLTLNAQNVCPCVPASKVWVVTVCDTWNCAMASLVRANGDPSVFAVPVAVDDGRWLVVRQVTSGTYIDNSPFQVESFDGASEAIARYSALADALKPHIMSSPDGKFLVISLRQPEQTPARRRSAGR